MPEIKIKVRDKCAEGEGVIICNNSDYTVVWDLDEEWTPYDTKTMRVNLSDGTYQDVVFTGDNAAMPVLTASGWVSVGLYAGDIHTSRAARLLALSSVLTPGGSPAAPSEDVYAQIMAKLNELSTVSPEDIVKAVEDYLSEHPIEETDPTVPEWAKAKTKPTYSAAEVGAISQSDLQAATDAALAQAKASGEFDGPRGPAGAPGKDGTAGADGVTPTIGDNGNWYIGSTDTGKPSRGATGATGPQGPAGAGMDITGATVGQIAKIAAVDASGVPTAWEPVDMPSCGGIPDVSWHAWDNVIVPEGGLNAFDFTTLASGEKLSDHQIKGMFIYSPLAASAVSAEGADQSATLTVNGDYVFNLSSFARSNPGFLRLLLTVENGLLIVRYYKRDTADRISFPASMVTINRSDLHQFGNMSTSSASIIGYGKTLKAFNQIQSVRIESSGQVLKGVEFDVQVLY